MNLDDIKQILELMREHELAEFELERDDFKLRVAEECGGAWTSHDARQMNFRSGRAPRRCRPRRRPRQRPAAAGADGRQTRSST